MRLTDSKKLILNKPNDEYPPDDTIRTIKSEELFQGDQKVLVAHEAEVYQLLVTKSGKLILNK